MYSVATAPPPTTLDPKVRVCSKAVAAFGLAAVGLLLAVGIGGVVPAWYGMRLAHAAAADIEASAGFLSGVTLVRWSRRLAWAAQFIAGAVVTLLLLYVILRFGLSGSDQDPSYGDDVT